MKKAQHRFKTIHGEVVVDIEIFELGALEATEAYDQDPGKFRRGGWRVEGRINGVPRGTKFYWAGLLGQAYFGEGTEDAAKDFLAEANADGFLESGCTFWGDIWVDDAGYATTTCDLIGVEAEALRLISDATLPEQWLQDLGCPKTADELRAENAGRIRSIAARLVQIADDLDGPRRTAADSKRRIGYDANHSIDGLKGAGK